VHGPRAPKYETEDESSTDVDMRFPHHGTSYRSSLSDAVVVPSLEESCGSGRVSSFKLR